MIDRVSFIVQYFPRVEKLHHVLCSLQHVIDDDKHLAKIILCFHFLPSNNCQALNRVQPGSLHSSPQITKHLIWYNTELPNRFHVPDPEEAAAASHLPPQAKDPLPALSRCCCRCLHNRALSR
eukprot:g46541.t1